MRCPSPPLPPVTSATAFLRSMHFLPYPAVSQHFPVFDQGATEPPGGQADPTPAHPVEPPSDHPVLCQNSKLTRQQSQFVAEDFSVVLTDQRCPSGNAPG